jgi:iron-sulfur cluster assembly accessory protein
MTLTPDITISDKARQRLVEFDVGADRFLRIKVVSGGCSGNTFDASVDDTLADSDEVVLQEGNLRVVTDGRSALFIDGLHIDYSDDLIQAGFRLLNRNASSACGCGASFAI